MLRGPPESHRSIWCLLHDPPSRAFVNLQNVDKASPAYQRRSFASLRVPPTTFCCRKSITFSPENLKNLIRVHWFFYVFLENLTVVYRNLLCGCCATPPESHRSICDLLRDPPSRPFANLQKVEEASFAYRRRPFASLRVPPTTFGCEKTLHFSPSKTLKT